MLGVKMVVYCEIKGHPLERFQLRSNMRERVIIKWGGGLITDKSSLCTPDLEILEHLAQTVSTCQSNDVDVVLVHGAGSFGHLRAKHWRLNEGALPDEVFENDDMCSSQREAVDQVRKEMLQLNSHVCEALVRKKLTPVIHPPHLWAKNTGPDFLGDLERFHQEKDAQVHVTFGDVVDVEGGERFGILSGDDLVARLAVELPHIKRLVFAIKGVDGLLRVPPEHANESDLIARWSPDIEFEGTHQSEIDVTGGIGLKAARGSFVASHGIEVIMVNGGRTERVLGAMLGHPVRGTIVTAKK
jgi:isopentenyl phosphate kinase